MKNQSFLLPFLISLPVSVFSQQAPEGVGATDGSGNLKYWLDANITPGIYFIKIQNGSSKFYRN